MSIQMINNYAGWAGILGIIPACLLCGAKIRSRMSVPELCPPCLQDLAISEQRCLRCALPLDHGEICGACLHQPPPFTETLALANYAAPLSHVIQQYKFNQKLAYGRSLGILLGHLCLMKNVRLPDAILPVPLHGQRLRQRGYNQAREMARMSSQYIYQQSGVYVPVDDQCCTRLRGTLEQSGLSRIERKDNVKNAFGVMPLAYEHVVLYDDVMTTGTTLSELAKVCLNKGAKRVDVWVCARAVVSP